MATDVQEIFERVPSMVVLDGLDEVGRLRAREKIVEAIDQFCRRGKAYPTAPRVIVTTRPSTNALPEPSTDHFDLLVLNPLDVKQRDVPGLSRSRHSLTLSVPRYDPGAALGRRHIGENPRRCGKGPRPSPAVVPASDRMACFCSDTPQEMIAVVRVPPSNADRQLIDSLNEAGFGVSHAQLERWRSFELLPPHRRQHLGRGRGSASTLDPEILELAIEIADRASATRPLQEITLRIFLERPDLTLAEKAIKSSLVWFIDRRMRSADRDAVDALRGRTPTTEEEVDPAAQKIIDFFKKKTMRGLPKSDREIIEALSPAMEMADLGLAATLGPSAISRERLLQILENLDPTGSDSRIQNIRIALQSEGWEKLFKKPLALTAELTPGHQKESVRESSLESIIQMRDLLATTAEWARMMNFLGEKYPNSPLVCEAIVKFEATVTGRAILWAYPVVEPAADDWRSDIQMLIARLALGDLRHIYEATMRLGDLLRQLLRDDDAAG